ncbi:MAG: SDR family NAD(P)-dependent oxidoreductase [Acidimicrobiales bacterium]|nr:SDR family NAD(P)-dependent oxidoreductase [Acidimicrobiales bacterium]
MGRFDGRVALLTGAASGIGRATALRLAADGATIAGFDRDGDGLAAVVREVADAGGRMTTTVGDVSIRESCVAAVEEAVEAHGRLDVLANIAGVCWSEHVADATEESWGRMLGINVSGVFWCCQAAIPHLIATNGNIVNIASNAGLMGQAYTVAYSTTKGAVVNMTRSLAMEFIKEPIRINAIAPGSVDTSLTRNYSLPDDLDFSLMQPYIGFRGMADAEELANVIAFVASDEASRIHGAIIPVDGGLTAG